VFGYAEYLLRLSQYFELVIHFLLLLLYLRTHKCNHAARHNAVTSTGAGLGNDGLSVAFKDYPAES